MSWIHLGFCSHFILRVDVMVFTESSLQRISLDLFHLYSVNKTKQKLVMNSSKYKKH